MKKVLIIQTQMKQYRAPLWARLSNSMQADGIQLTIAYSDPPETELRKNDNCELPPEYGLKVRGYSIWRDGLLYQPLLKLAITSDLVIVEQRTRLLLNSFLLPLSRAGLRKVAFWGHGENLNAEKMRLSGWYRRRVLNWVSWWFAYTKHTARYLESCGVPSSQITVLQNSVDTSEIRLHVQSLTDEERAIIRARIGVPSSGPIGVFCGRLEKLKGLPLLIESCRLIKSRIPSFHLVIVGGGPDEKAFLQLIKGMDWVHWAGPRFGKEKAEVMAISDVFLLAGAVGLAVLDAFSAGLPVITIRSKLHGPEIEYLQEDLNALISDASPGEFADTVCSVLSRNDHLARLRAGASGSSENYSIENMAENFRTGIRSCLGLSKSSAKVLGLQKAN
jgi:glycosyltransferase involved in cell wall biosynthesis